MSTATVASPVRRPGPIRLGTFEKIDVCRGLFAYLVVIAHGRDMAWVMQPTHGPAGLWESVHGYLVGTGIYWVMGFFVISGYCIELSVERLEASGGFRFNDYLAARLTRILPLYYLGFLFAAAVEWLVGANRPEYWTTNIDRLGVLYQIFEVQGVAGAFGSYGPSWSITHELFYYLLFGALVVGCAGRRNHPRLIGMIACFLIGGSLQAAYSLGMKSPLTLQAGMLFGLGTNWFLGALTARHREALVGNRAVTAAARAWPVLLLAAIAVHASGWVRPGIVFVGCGPVFALMLVRFLDGSRDVDRKLREGSPTVAALCRWMGLSSYPTYLFHGPILILIGTAINRWSLTENRGLIWLVSSVIAVACGVALGFLVEQPIMAWRAGILARRRGRGAGVRSTRPGWQSLGSVRHGMSREIQEGVA